MSLPFIYVAVGIESNDGQAHDVRVYFDMTGGKTSPVTQYFWWLTYPVECLSGDMGQDMSWGTSISSKNDIVYHDFAIQAPQEYIEKNLKIQYGRAFHATTLTQGVSYATCPHTTCRDMFGANGQLDRTNDSPFRAISNNWPVMALSYSFGTITQTQQPVVFAFGHTRDPVVEYQRFNNVFEERSLFFHTSFDTIEDAVSSFSSQVGYFSSIGSLLPAFLLHQGLSERSQGSQCIR